MCNVLMMREMDKRFSSDGMVVSALFPGCIAESPLFREKRGWFRAGFPVFQKLITKQFVSTAVRNAFFLFACERESTVIVSAQLLEGGFRNTRARQVVVRCVSLACECPRGSQKFDHTRGFRSAHLIHMMRRGFERRFGASSDG